MVINMLLSFGGKVEDGNTQYIILTHVTILYQHINIKKMDNFCLASFFFVPSSYLLTVQGLVEGKLVFNTNLYSVVYYFTEELFSLKYFIQ